MNEQIRQAIQTRARKAKSNDDLVSAVFYTFEAAHINPSEVSLDDMKTAIVTAARAARAAREAKPTASASHVTPASQAL